MEDKTESQYHRHQCLAPAGYTQEEWDRPYDFSKNPELKMPEGAVGHAAYGPFLNQELLDQYIKSKGGEVRRPVVRRPSHYRFPQ
jgi:hypothetical protein